ncbi:MAG: thiamine pyrophosphate-dependent enzyme [Terracidiphilus sp.]|jgi:TPP-dependent pyruvate/acetoin dehydrogenase alpha subunit
MKDQSAAALAGNNGFSLISNEKLLQLYASMVQCRQLAEQLKNLRPLDGFNATLGLEATIVGVAIDAQPRDTVISLQRNLAVEFLQGASLQNCFRSTFAGAASPSPASRLKAAVAAAQGNAASRNGKIAVLFSGVDQLPSDLWQQALIQAQASRLPIILVRQNALLAEPENRNAKSKPSPKANAANLPSIAADANDVVAVYRIATEAITHARKGNGPTLIQCTSQNARHADPIAAMEAYLSRKRLFTQKIKLKIAATFARQLVAAVPRARVISQ